MKTSLKYISLFLAVSLPTTMTADALGLLVPTALSATSLFGALVTAFALLTIVSDYGRQSRLPLRAVSASPSSNAPAPVPSKSANPLAA